eukprot:COSAG05_NODE_2839_length_2582_cov_2.163109_1_plen_492_part_00
MMASPLMALRTGLAGACRATALTAVAPVGSRGFRASAPALGKKARRLSPMSSKRGNKNYYKGKGARPMGRSTKHGNYKIDAPAIAHALYEEPDLAEPDEYWEPERLPTNRSKMQALVDLIHKCEVRRLRPWDAHPKWVAGECSGWCDETRQLRHRVPEDFEGPLWRAAAEGRVAQTTALLAETSSVRAPDAAHGRTPLHYAAMFGRLPCIRALLPHSDSDAADNEGRTAVQLAARGGHFHAVCLLQDPTASADTAGGKGAADEDGIYGWDPQELVFKLERHATEGFGLQLDARGVLTGYSGPSHTSLFGVGGLPAVPDGGYTPGQLQEIRQKLGDVPLPAMRPAEKAGVPLGALCVSVGGEPVVGKTEIVQKLRSLQIAHKEASSDGGKAGQPTVEFAFQAPRAALGSLRKQLQLLDTVEELEREALHRGVPEHEIVVAKTAIWGAKSDNRDPNECDAPPLYYTILYYTILYYTILYYITHPPCHTLLAVV